MQREKFLASHKAIRDKMGTTTEAKNADYSGESDDAFQNFKLVQALGIADVPTAIMVRMSDKMARISSYLQLGSLKVSDESVMDSCIDLANYAVILAIWFENQKNVGVPTQPSLIELEKLWIQQREQWMKDKETSQDAIKTAFDTVVEPTFI